jgi:hypothetical protein
MATRFVVEHTKYVLTADISIRLAHMMYLHKHILSANFLYALHEFVIPVYVKRV